MRIASIDLGTNTLLLLVADIDNDGVITPIYHEQQIPRLGKNVDASKTIDASVFQNISGIISSYKATAIKLHAEKIVACGTSALRDARNKKDFIDAIAADTGIVLEVLSGEQEALWTYRGATSGGRNSSTASAVIDIGGGSTEITFPGSNYNAPIQRYSFDIGAVRITERFLHHSPPLTLEVQNARDHIAKIFNELPKTAFSKKHLIGVAGTVTTLACLDQSLKEFELEKVSGYLMNFERIDDWNKKLSNMPPAKVLELTTAAKGREDILFAGVLILREFMSRFGYTTMEVSERGLRYGLVIREWEQTTGIG